MIKRSTGEKLHLKKIIGSRPGFPESWVDPPSRLGLVGSLHRPVFFDKPRPGQPRDRNLAGSLHRPIF
jgi:hypothetical protein